ncbi:beta-ketoacyl synthase N-terminal-like domain-containing protein [Streptomyces sp. NPDC089919]|uniref:type I polyketide synthase n=1 Tax=Streptomyces sp. NPDC089919 TaxID=3155188 RepID=UPI003430D50C
MAEPRSGPRPGDAAIVGMGALFPGAADLAAYRRNVFGGVDAIGEVPPGRWDPQVYYDPAAAGGPARSDRFYCRRGGFVDGLAAFDPTRFGIMPSAADGAEPDQLLALHATAQALADAGGEERLPADRSRIGVILGRGGFMGTATARLDQRVRTAHQLATSLRELAPELGEERITAVRTLFQEALGPERPDASIGLVPSFTAARIANRLDFQGPAYTLDAACASSLLAVDQAVGLLAAGRCDLVVAGAVHHCHIATLWSVFTQLRALSPSEHIRPFDRRADGTLLSEGTGVVLLKRLADAERDGDRIYAVLRGVGVAGDGRAASLMSPLVDGQVRALERAWRDAGLDPGSPGALGLLEAHGTGTPVGDAAELATLGRVFGGPGPAGPDIALGSVKSMVGHAMQASGMAGLIKAALAVHEGVLPPTLHLEEPHAGFAGTRMRPVTTPAPWDRTDRAPRRAGVNAFGFGGINAHVILEEAPGAGAAPGAGRRSGRTAAGRPRTAGGSPGRRFLPAPESGPVPGPEAVLRLSAEGPRELAGQLAQARAGGAAAASPAAVGRPGAGPAPASPAGDGPYRLAVVGPTPQRLALAARVVERGLPWRGRGGVWFTPRPLLGPHAAAPGRIAFLFPGLEPEFAPLVADAADRLGLPRPVLGGGPGLIERALDAIAVGRFYARALPALGIRPDLLAGHSLGEWAAMVVAGMYPEQAVDSFLGALEPDSLKVPDLVYAALGCGAERAARALHGLDRVVVSHDNCPHQSVVCGAPEQVAEVLARLRGDGVLGQELPFRSGFHTPMWEPYLGQVKAAFGRLPLRPAELPVWSATTGEPYPEDPEGVRRLVLRHLLEPVDFRTLALRLYERAGVRAFVTAGPGSLTGFVEDTLRGREHLAVNASVPRTDGLAGLRRLAAALWTEGLAPDWTRITDPVPGPRPDEPVAARRPDPPTAGPRPADPAAGPAHAPARPAPPPAGDRARALDLGSPLVRLGAAARSLGPGPVPAGGPTATGGRATAPAYTAGAGDPDLAPADDLPAALRTALAAVLDEARDAVATVAGAWRRPPAPRPLPDGLPGPAAAAAPPVPSGPAGAPYEETRTLSLETLPAVADHCVYLQPQDWPHDADRFPVVPMTTMLELAAEAALRTLPPGTPAVVVGYEDMRALRWLPVAPAVEVRIGARPEPGGRVRVRIGDCATVTVLLAAAHQAAAPPPDPAPLTGEAPAPVSAEALYRDRWMFHGPRFAGVHEVTTVAEDGLRGVLRALPAPGALLDAAGQLLGHWMQLKLDRDRLVFPAVLGRIRLYGPPPRPGELLAATARIHEVGPASVRGEVELRSADGTVRARLEDWTYRRFAADERVWPMKFTPEVCGIGEPQPGGWCTAVRRWTDPASQELVMRRYLGTAERAAYERLGPRARSAWLLGRIAAKDALRELLWDAGAGPVFPAEVTVTGDATGRPVPGGLAAGLRLSIAHKDHLAVALAHPDTDVGIDVETVTEDPDALRRIALTPDEALLAERLAARAGTGLPVALTTLWCAKEAAAKAAGTGLRGRPREWTVTAGPEADGLYVTAPTGHRHPVRTCLLHAPPRPGAPPVTHVVARTDAPPRTPDTRCLPTPTETGHGI